VRTHTRPDRTCTLPCSTRARAHACLTKRLRFILRLPVILALDLNCTFHAPRTSLCVRAPEALRRKTTDLSGVKVLVVDDEPDARALLKRVRDECDAEVFTASNAVEALGVVQQHRPHVLVSDIGMPDVDGYELLRRIRTLGEANGGKLPAIALTAFARSEDRTRALRAGFLVHVSKPVEPSELIATVAAVAGHSGAAERE
jgi:CheY-like chemotaxis protein